MGVVLSLNEFMIALFLATPDTETLPKVIWPNLRYTLTSLVAAASCVTMVLTLLGLVLTASLLRVERFTNRLLSRGKQ
jgi:ABC-type spermidine/putrescine transport system permease subunit II